MPALSPQNDTVEKVRPLNITAGRSSQDGNETLCFFDFSARLSAAMMIDIFNHFMPKAYLDRLGDLIPGHPVLTAFPRLKTLWDVDARRTLIDEFGEMQHVLSLANPPPEL